MGVQELFLLFRGGNPHDTGHVLPRRGRRKEESEALEGTITGALVFVEGAYPKQPERSFEIYMDGSFAGIEDEEERITKSQG